MMDEFFEQSLGWVVLLIVLAIALTMFVFRKRLFERGPRKGVARNPQQVKDENRPDEWSRSHR
jgi:hypothetical protein